MFAPLSETEYNVALILIILAGCLALFGAYELVLKLIWLWQHLRIVSN